MANISYEEFIKGKNPADIKVVQSAAQGFSDVSGSSNQENDAAQEAIKYSQPGFFKRVGADLSQRGTNIAEDLNSSKTLLKKRQDYLPGEQNPLSGGLQIAGQVFGGLSDILGEGFSSALDTVGLKKPLDKAIVAASQLSRKTPAKGFSSALDTVGLKKPDVNNVIQQVRDWAAAHPEAAKNLGAIGNLGMGVFDATGAGEAAQGVKAATGAGIRSAANVARGVAETIPSVTEATVSPIKVSPFAKSFNKPLAEEFASEGIKPPVSAVTNSPFVKGAEALASKSAFGQKINELAIKASNALEKKTSEIIDRIKPPKTISDEGLGQAIQKGAKGFESARSDLAMSARPEATISDEELGKTIQSGLRDYEDNFKSTQGKIFDAFGSKFGSTTTEASGTKGILSEIIDQQGKDFFKGVDPRIKSMFSKLTGEADPDLQELRSNLAEIENTSISKDAKARLSAGLKDQIAAKSAEVEKMPTFDELKSTRTSVGEALSKDPENAAYKRLYGALSQDMEASVAKTAETPFGSEAQSAVDALRAVNDGYATGKNQIESNIARSIMQSNPESIAKNLVKRNSVGMLNQLHQMIGDVKFKQVQDYFMKDLIENANKDGRFEVSKLMKGISKYDEPTIEKLLGDENFSKINDLIAGLKGTDSASEVAKQLVNDTPENIAKNIVKRNGADYLKNVKAVIGPAKFSEVSQSFMRDLFEKSVTRGQFDVGKAMKTLESYDKETLGQLFDKKQTADLRAAFEKLTKYQRLQDALKTGQKAAEGSQTAFLQNIKGEGTRGIALASALASGHVGIAALIAAGTAGEVAFTRVFTSELGRKLLTEGLELGGKVISKPKAPDIGRYLSAFNLTNAEKNQIAKALTYTVLLPIVNNRNNGKNK